MSIENVTPIHHKNGDVYVVAEETPSAGRPTWDKTWMDVAWVLADRSVCDGRRIGCVIVDTNNRPVAMGYNGPPSGYQRTSDSCIDWCPRMLSSDRTIDYGNCYTIHAEANALIFADRREYEGGTLYVTSAICWDCGKMVANSGIGTVVMFVTEEDAHRDPERTIEFLEQCGLEVITL